MTLFECARVLLWSSEIFGASDITRKSFPNMQEASLAGHEHAYSRIPHVPDKIVGNIPMGENCRCRMRINYFKAYHTSPAPLEFWAPNLTYHPLFLLFIYTRFP